MFSVGPDYTWKFAFEKGGEYECTVETGSESRAAFYKRDGDPEDSRR
jgi:hypothetical protein